MTQSLAKVSVLVYYKSLPTNKKVRRRKRKVSVLVYYKSLPTAFTKWLAQLPSFSSCLLQVIANKVGNQTIDSNKFQFLFTTSHCQPLRAEINLGLKKKFQFLFTTSHCQLLERELTDSCVTGFSSCLLQVIANGVFLATGERLFESFSSCLLQVIANVLFSIVCFGQGRFQFLFTTSHCQHIYII